MKTLVIISHPDITESSSQQYLLSSVPENQAVTVHHLEKVYADGKIDAAREQALLLEHDRILFQFPFYWYSSPAMLKLWQDEVLEEGFAYGKRGTALHEKEFGLVLNIGIKKSDYQAGGREGFSISELTKPYQALALKTGMSYLKPLEIYQFAYMTEEQRMELLIEYQQLLTRERSSSLEAREKWLLHELENTPRETLGAGDGFVLEQAIEFIEENRDAINELNMLLDQMD